MKTPERWQDMLEMLKDFLHNSPEAESLWHVLTALRGPDSPSERPDMGDAESSEAYAGRRRRKRMTVEVIRGKALGGKCLGARVRTDIDYVTLPPESEWEHFDRHVRAAAVVLGLKVKTGPEGRWKKELKKEGIEGCVPVKVVEAPPSKPEEKMYFSKAGGLHSWNLLQPTLYPTFSSKIPPAPASQQQEKQKLMADEQLKYNKTLMEMWYATFGGPVAGPLGSAQGDYKVAEESETTSD